MGLSVGSAFGDSKFVPVSTAEPPTVLDCCPIETRSTNYFREMPTTRQSGLINAGPYT